MRSSMLFMTVVMSTLAAGAGPATTQRATEPLALVQDMAGRGHDYDPAPLVKHGVKGLRVVLDSLFPNPNPHAMPDGALYEYRIPFTRYLDELKDRPSLEFLSEWVVPALRWGRKGDHRRLMVSHVIGRIVREKDDSLLQPLLPLIDPADARLAVFIVASVGGSASRPLDFFPKLLLAALESPDPEIVEEGLRWTPNCQDERHRGDVRRLVRRVFDGDNEKLKFQACFPLMHDYEDPDAIRYLIVQTRSKDPERARWAVGWLGDASNYGDKASDELIRALEPLMRSADIELRQCVAAAFGTYTGEAPVRHLVAMLADPAEVVVDEARRALSHNWDREAVRAKLTDAAATSPIAAVRQYAAEVLAELKKDPR